MSRERLPMERSAVTHKFTVGGQEGYLTVGMYPDGRPGEVFLTASKTGSTVNGLLDTVATLTSLALQHGVPLETLVAKFRHVRFEPSGRTEHPHLREAASIVDYVFGWLGLAFLGVDTATALARGEAVPTPRTTTDADVTPRQVLRDAVGDVAVASIADQPGWPDPAPATVAPIQAQSDAPPCSTCGAIMIRSGACYKCFNCGNTSGCG